MRTQISVDPGREGACALWREGAGCPFLTNMWVPPKDWSWEKAMRMMGAVLDAECKEHIPSVMWCEWPHLNESSEAGRKTARTGSLVKLAASVGIAMEVCRRYRVMFIPVEVHSWKGQMSKAAVERRIRRILPAEFCETIKSHEWDAVGIGLHKKGRFRTWPRP